MPRDNATGPGRHDPPDLDAFDEATLVARAQVEPNAFAPLYARYAPLILAYCYRRIGNREDAADATAMVFTRALGSLHRFRFEPTRPGSTFRAWLFTIARNIVIDTYRTSRPTVPIDAPQALEIADGHPSPESQAIHAEDARAVRNLLLQLPERQRAVVELRLAGLSTSEIARTLGQSEPAVKSHQVRAYRALRTLVGESSSPQPREHRS